jgi:hypothetical protein
VVGLASWSEDLGHDRCGEARVEVAQVLLDGSCGHVLALRQRRLGEEVHPQVHALPLALCRGHCGRAMVVGDAHAGEDGQLRIEHGVAGTRVPGILGHPAFELLDELVEVVRAPLVCRSCSDPCDEASYVSA